jgi:TM2 domain-containing membrane protein YozV
MSAAVCPYCRAPIEPDSGEPLLCDGCGTPHHAACYKENGGCTVFGCKNAPADEQKVTLTGRDLAHPTATAVPAPTIGNLPAMLPGVGLTPPGWNPHAPAKPVKAPPPPLPPGASPAPPPAAAAAPRAGVGSMFFNAATQPQAPAPAAAIRQQPFDYDFQSDPNAKNRSTFIVLGALLGYFGAHNFYAGYYVKAIGQLCLTCLTLGFGSVMSWVWAVIEICIIDCDKNGIKFRS